MGKYEKQFFCETIFLEIVPWDAIFSRHELHLLFLLYNPSIHLSFLSDLGCKFFEFILGAHWPEN